MEKSEAINELAAALCKAQAAVKPAIRECENKHYKHWYADLSACLDACEQALTENGLALIQSPVSTDHGAGVETLLIHKSGQWISDRLVLPVGKQDPQAYGSAITYARRYTLEGFLRLRREDDDGEGALPQPTPPQQQPRQPAQQPVQNKQTPAQQPAATAQPAADVAPAKADVAPAKANAPVPVANRVKAFEAKLIAERLCFPGELTQHVIEVFKDRFTGPLTSWPDAVTDEVRDVCKDFELQARDGLLITQTQIEQMGKELYRTGMPWTRILKAERLSEATEINDLTVGQWKSIMEKLEQTPDVRR